MINEIRLVPTRNEIVHAFFKERDFVKGWARLALGMLMLFARGIAWILGPKTTVK